MPENEKIFFFSIDKNPASSKTFSYKVDFFPIPLVIWEKCDRLVSLEKPVTH